MKRIPLNEIQIKAQLSGATELRVPVKPQPSQCAVPDGTWADQRGAPIPVDVWAWGHHRFGSLDALRAGLLQHCPYPVGSMVALTETWALSKMFDDRNPPVLDRKCIWYPDEVGSVSQARRGRWRSPATMPAEFSRFKRRVNEVRVEHGTEWEWVLTLEVNTK